MRVLFYAGFAAVLLVFLILFAAASGWLGLSLRYEVRPLEAITLATNLLIAFFLQRFIVTRVNDLRAEKNVLIAVAGETIRLINEVRERTDAQLLKNPISDGDTIAIISGFRRVANSMNDLQVSLEMSHLKSVGEVLRPMWSEFYALKALATGGGFPVRGYSVEQRSSQDRCFRTLTARCRRLIFVINDARR